MLRPLFVLAALLTSFSSALAAPHITSVDPNNGPTAGGTTITINGTGFGSVAGEVRFSGNLADVRTWLSTRITCTLPPGNSGETSVTVKAGGVDSDNIGLFFYAAPQITSLDPSSGPASGGTLLTIHGSNFGLASGGRVTTIDGVEAPESQYLGHDAIVVVTPAGSQGTVPVVVRLNGFSSNSASFTYTEPTAVFRSHALGFALGQNRPNPVVDRTRIPIELPEASSYSLGVFDVRGRLVRRLDGSAPAGARAIEWDAKDEAGRRAPAGLYFYRFAARGGWVATRRLLLTR
jgi:hypothetical protein